MEQSVEGVPEAIIDDGAAFIFGVGNVSCGFMHRPSDTAELVGGTVTPPVKWTVYHNLESWVETIKYAARNNKKIAVLYDDAIYINYKSGLIPTLRGEAQEEVTFSRCIRLRNSSKAPAVPIHLARVKARPHGISTTGVGTSRGRVRGIETRR
jgi:hypothetical protein